MIGRVLVALLVGLAPATDSRLSVETPADALAVAVRLDPPDPPTPDGPADAHCPQWWSEARDAGWPEQHLAHIDWIMYRESGCDPRVRSRTSDTGLMQINDVVLRDWRFRRDWPGFDPASLYDPLTNLSVALWLWGVDGWGPWG